MLHINTQATKLYFTPETMLVIAFHSYLGRRIQQPIFLKVWVIETSYLQF